MSPSLVPEPPSAPALPAHLGLVAGLSAGADFLANTTVSVSSAYVRGGVSAAPEDFLWVFTLYAAAGTTAILFLDRLSRALRYRTLLMLGLAVFMTGSLLAAVSESFQMLLVARVIQGLGGGPLMTVARVLVQTAVPARQRPTQLKGFMIGILGSTSLAPWLSTHLIQAWDWHAVFVLHLAYACTMLLACWQVLPDEVHQPRSLGEADWVAAAAFVIGTLSFLHAFEAMHYHWLDLSMAWGLCAGAAALGFLGWHLHRHPDPWFDLRRISSQRYVMGVAFYGLYYLISGALNYFTPLYLESGEGYNVETAGNIMTAASLTATLLLPVYFRAAPFLTSRRHVIATGFAVMGVTLYWLSAHVTGGTPMGTLLPAFALKGVFPVLVAVQVAGLTFKEFQHLDFAHAYALKNVLRQLALAVGAGVGNLYWLKVSATARTDLVGQIGGLSGEAPEPAWTQSTAALSTLSRLLDQQAALISAQQCFLVLAVACAIGCVLILCQKALQ